MPSKTAKPLRPYWDACVFISLIQRTAGRVEVLDAIKKLAQDGRLIVVTSSLVMGEVIKMDEGDPQIEEDMKRVADFLDNPWITRRVPDNVICTRAGILRRMHPPLKLPDAIHIATALHYEVDVLHSYDSHLLRLDGMLDFDGKARKGRLKICPPEVPDKEYPLLDTIDD